MTGFTEVDLQLEWEGHSFLDSIDGPTTLYPPFRVLFLVFRLQANGRLTLGLPDRTSELYFQRGKLIQLTGIPGIVQGVGRALADHDDLHSGMEAALNAGSHLTDVVKAVAVGLTREMSRWVDLPQGKVTFESQATPATRCLPLDLNLSLLMDRALRTPTNKALAHDTFRNRSRWMVTAHLPTDSPQHRWGLDSVALRILRSAQRPVTLKALYERASSGRASQAAVLRRLFLLKELGMLELTAPPRAGSVDPDPDDRRERVVPSRKERERATIEQELLSRMQATLTELRQKPLLARLELDDAKRLPNAEAVSAAFRNRSKRYHPDRHAESPESVRRLASELFSVINETYESLQRPEVLAEEWRRVTCEREGVPFVSAMDYTQARIAFKKGELQYRNRDYRVAEACLMEATRLDPTRWEYPRLHTLCAFLAKQMPAAQALDKLDEINVSDPTHRAIIEATKGQILKLDGAPKSAYIACFKRAVAHDPENHEAKREIRLHEMRSNRSRDGAGILGRLLRRDGD